MKIKGGTFYKYDLFTLGLIFIEREFNLFQQISLDSDIGAFLHSNDFVSINNIWDSSNSMSFVKKDEKYSGIYFLSKLNAHLEPYFSNNLANVIEKKILSNELVEVLDSSNRIGYLIYQHDTKIRLNER